MQLDLGLTAAGSQEKISHCLVCDLFSLRTVFIIIFTHGFQVMVREAHCDL
jgi:hypothetical protein